MCAEGWEGYQGKDLQCPSSQGMTGVSFSPFFFSNGLLGFLSPLIYAPLWYGLGTGQSNWIGNGEHWSS